MDRFTISTTKEFNTKLWARAAVDRQYSYQASRSGRSQVDAEEGEPPGVSNGMKSVHRQCVIQWFAFEYFTAQAEGRPQNYSLVYKPPAKDSKEQAKGNGAKLVAFYRYILELFDADDQAVPGIGTQTKKCWLAFLEHLLAAQFADCPEDEQEFAELRPADKETIEALAKRIDTEVRQRKTPQDPYSETLGAAITEQDMLKYYHLTVKQTKGYSWGNVVSIKAVLAHMYLNANRAVRKVRLLLGNVVDEELHGTAKSELSGVSAERLLVHGFALQCGGPGAQDKLRGATSRWELDGFMRHRDLNFCAAGKVADYVLLRFRDEPLQPALVSAEALLAFMGKHFFMRHNATQQAPKAYTIDTIKNTLTGDRKRGGCPGLQARAGVQHVEGKLLHRVKHGGVRTQIDLLGSVEEQKRYAKHGGKVQEASYSNRTWVSKLSMAKVAGHRHDFVQLYRAGIWCSIKQDAAFKGLVYPPPHPVSVCLLICTLIRRPRLLKT